MMLQQYIAACAYPGRLDEAAVTEALLRYCAALGVKRSIVQLRRGWQLSEHQALNDSIDAILIDFNQRRVGIAAHAARAARAAHDARVASDAHDASAAHDARVASDARDASDASDARVASDARDASDASDASDAHAASHRFAVWCINRSWWWSGELSWLAVVALGAKQLKLSSVSAWADPVFDAFVAGAHLVYWTDRAIYWIAKPTTHVETTPFGRRLHRDDGPALSSDLEDLYFWHGILVPEHIIMRPEIITEREIGNEVNQEVRRVMIERYGYGRYMASSPIVHQDATGKLRRRHEIQVVEVVNGSAEPDGSFRRYVLSVPPDLNTAKSAVAWTYGMSVSEYSKLIVRT